MRIALTCPYAWDRPGGVRTHVASLARALRSDGHEVLVVAPRSMGARPDREDGVVLAGRCVPVPVNGSVAPIAPGPDALIATRRALAAFGPDVVHLHEPLAPSVSLFGLWGHDAPSVGTFHSAGGTAGLYRLFGPVLRPVAARLTLRTAVSTAAIAALGTHLPGTYALTPNGVDVTRFSGASDTGPQEPTILFLGRIEPRKGLDVLLHALARLRDLDPMLVVAGAGPGAAAARRLVDDLGVRVRWRGAVPDDEIPAVYAGASVFCHPATRGESFGIVLLEAMAAGRPVVCSDLPGFRAAGGDAPVYVAPGDPAALAAALRSVLAADAESAALAALSRARAALFDWRVLAAEVASLYGSARGHA